MEIEYLRELLALMDEHNLAELSLKDSETELIEKLLGLIEVRDARILRMRYGLDNGDPMTLKEIGERVNLSRERVRQIENEALKKLYYILTHEKERVFQA